MRFIWTTLRFIVGFVLFAAGCAEAVRIASGKSFADVPIDARSPEFLGSLSAALLMLGLGVVGLRMLTSLMRRKKVAEAR